MTNETVDLTNCDREPIHILGAIQPIGLLIALTADWLVARVSTNVAQFTGQEPAQLFGSPLQDVFSPKAMHDLRNRSALLQGPDAVERVFDCALVEGKPSFDVALHISDGQLVIEAEQASGEHGDATGTIKVTSGEARRISALIVE